MREQLLVKDCRRCPNHLFPLVTKLAVNNIDLIKELVGANIPTSKIHPAIHTVIKIRQLATFPANIHLTRFLLDTKPDTTIAMERTVKHSIAMDSIIVLNTLAAMLGSSHIANKQASTADIIASRCCTEFPKVVGLAENFDRYFMGKGN